MTGLHGGASSSSTLISGENTDADRSTSENHESTHAPPAHYYLQLLFWRFLWWLFPLPPRPAEPSPSAQTKANVFSRLFFSWCFPTILRAATESELNLNDIGLIDPRRETIRKFDLFNDLLRQYASPGYGSRMPLVRAIYRAYRTHFVVFSICELIGSYLDLVTSPLIYFLGKHLYQVFHYGGDDVEMLFPKYISMAYVIGIALVSYLSRLLRVHAEYKAALLGGEVRTLLCASIYAKAMRISRTAIQPSKVKAHTQAKKKALEQKLKSGSNSPDTDSCAEDGISDINLRWDDSSILNAMTIDTKRIEAAIAFSNTFWASFATLPILLVLSWFYLSWPGLFGILITGLSPLVLLGFGNFVSKRRARLNQFTRERAELTLGMIRGVRIIKMFAWENFFLARFDAKRREETKRLVKLVFDIALLASISMASSRYPSLLLYVVYSFYYPGGMNLGYNIMALQSAIMLSSSTVNRMIRNIPKCFNSIASFENIQDLLLAQEEEPGKDFEKPRSSTNAIELDQACFSWGKEDPTLEQSREEANQASKFALHPITLTLKRSELVAIVGSVRAGKSTLAASLAGQTQHIDGRVGISLDKVSYCAQDPWIQNESLRENITFGQPFDRKRYERILRACALDHDIESSAFAQGDLTEIGERGITISGGQKARLQLARTLYCAKPTVILDDPLGALDSRTLRHVFEQAILGELGDTCRLLVTHQVHILNRCSRVIWMQAGRVRAIDTYAALMENEPEFVEFVRSASDEKADIVENEDIILPDNKKTTKSKRNMASPGLITKEKSDADRIPWSLYRLLLQKSASWVYLAILFLELAASQVLNMCTSMMIAIWSARLFGPSDSIYVILTLICIVGHNITWASFCVAIQQVCINTSRALTHQAFAGVLRAPQSFFDTTWVGTITNRLTTDVDNLDQELPGVIWNSCISIMAVVSIMASVAAYVPFSLVLFVPWLIGITSVIIVSSSTPLALQRVESVSRSRLDAKLVEGLSGRVSLNSYGRLADFQMKLFSKIDELNSVRFAQSAIVAWFSTRCISLTFLLTVFIGVLVAQHQSSLPPSLCLYVLAICSEFSKYLVGGLSLSMGLQRGMNSLQRILWYCNNLPDEGPWVVPEAVGASWPSDGSIEITNASMRHRDDLELCLSNIDLHVASGEKIAIVGRTGAGKSSFISMLLRTAPLESGSIKIGGIDTAAIGLHTLREAMPVIPQNPTLFPGELWFNLDPKADPSDLITKSRMMAALRDVRLIDDENGEENMDILRTSVSDGGSEFSAGSRQLISLARALLRASRILLIDEATSSVDYANDTHIQGMLRKRFADRTVITIAHRIHTTLFYDRVCVMRDGRIAEIDTPQALLARNSLFRELYNDSKMSEAESSNP